MCRITFKYSPQLCTFQKTIEFEATKNGVLYIQFMLAYKVQGGQKFISSNDPDFTLHVSNHGVLHAIHYFCFQPEDAEGSPEHW